MLSEHILTHSDWEEMFMCVGGEDTMCSHAYFLPFPVHIFSSW